MADEEKGKKRKFWEFTDKDEEERAKGEDEGYGSADSLFTEEELDEMNGETPRTKMPVVPKTPEGQDPDLISSSEALLALFAPNRGGRVSKNSAVDSLEGEELHYSNGYTPKQILRELATRIRETGDPHKAIAIHDAFLHQGYSDALKEAGLKVRSQVRDGKASVTASFELEKALAGSGMQMKLIEALKKKAVGRADIDFDVNNGLLKLRVAGEIPEGHDLRGLLHPESEHLSTMRSLLKVADEHVQRAVRERR